MPVYDEDEADTTINYRQKYKTLKRKLRLLVYEQECFMDELRKSQRKLLRVARDRSFLLDRLMQYEKPEVSSDEQTESTDSDTDHKKDGLPSSAKKKKPPTNLLAAYNSTGLLGNAAAFSGSAMSSQGRDGQPPKKRAKVVKRKTPVRSSPVTNSSQSSVTTVPLTREEIERQLEMRQKARPHFMRLEQTPHSLPDDIFSNDNSNQDR